MRWLPRVAAATWLRLGICAIALMFATSADHIVAGLPWILLVATLDVAAAILLAVPTPRRRQQALALITVCAALAGVAQALVGNPVSMLLLVPAFHAGEQFRRRGTLLVVAAGAAAAVGTHVARGTLDPSRAFETVQWSLLASAIALLGVLSHRLEPAEETSETARSAEAAEAGALLRRLHELAGSLDTGFDAPASAEMALQQLADRMRSTRSAVLVGHGDDPAIPLAIRGGDRTPWPDPTDPDSVLATAWQQERPMLTRWDEQGVERSLIAVPLFDAAGSRIGVLVADRPAVTVFSEADLQAATSVARTHAPNIDLSLLFASLRERAGLEERERLAREMHDGIAQEMVALGFGIDALRRLARMQSSPLAPDLDLLREDLSRVLSDLRVHISDLRITVRPDTGLGAMISTRLQNFGSTSGTSTRMQLRENGFRLPAHTEVLIYRLLLQVLTDARHATGTTSVDVRLAVDAPRVEFQVAHDGQSALTQEDFANSPLTALGGDIVVSPHQSHGVLVRLRMRARGRDSAELTEERIPQPS